MDINNSHKLILMKKLNNAIFKVMPSNIVNNITLNII